MLGLSGKLARNWSAQMNRAQIVLPGGDVGAQHVHGLRGQLQLCKLPSASDQQHGDTSARARPSSRCQMEKRCCKFVHAACLMSAPQQSSLRLGDIANCLQTCAHAFLI